MKQKTIVLVTGGFDPIHSGHLQYLEEAKKLGDELWVGLNSDDWLTRKKGQPFMPLNERVEITKRLYMVDAVIDFDDSDDSACAAIFKTRSLKYIFSECDIISIHLDSKEKNFNFINKKYISLMKKTLFL